MPVPRPENLQPVRTKEEARERGRNGGIKSGIARREKKLQSEAYARAMAKKYKVAIDGKEHELDWEDFQSIIIRDIMMKREGCSVSLMREMREATEGGKLGVKLEGLPQVSVLLDLPEDEGSDDENKE